MVVKLVVVVVALVFETAQRALAPVEFLLEQQLQSVELSAPTLPQVQVLLPELVGSQLLAHPLIDALEYSSHPLLL